MAECIECGTQMGFGIKGYCGICHVARLNTSKDAPMSVSSLETPITSKSNKPSSQTASEGSTPAATAFTSLAWVIVALTFICTVPTVLTARRHLEAPSMPRVPINRTPSHLADTSDPCQRPMQTDGHGHPPKGVSSCPVGKIRRWGGPIMRLAKHLGIDVLPPQLALTA